MIRRILCAVSALLLAGSLMTACGTQDDAGEDNRLLTETETLPIEADAESTDTASADGTAASAVTTTAAETASLDDSDIAAARAAAEQFWESCLQGDADAMLAGTNLAETLPLMFAEDEIDGMLAELRESLLEISDVLVSYELGEGAVDAELLAQYNEAVELLRGELADLDEVPDEAMLQWLVPLDGICVFPVTVTESNGTVSTENMTVVQQDGKWSVDILLMEILSELMLSYVDVSETQSANIAAKSLDNAALAALTDLDAEGMDLSLLQGDYMLTGDDFASAVKVTDPQTESQALAAMQYRVMLYFSDAALLDAVMLRIENGICTAAAVEKNGAFGTYPYPADAETVLRNIEQALQYAVDGTE